MGLDTHRMDCFWVWGSIPTDDEVFISMNLKFTFWLKTYWSKRTRVECAGAHVLCLFSNWSWRRRGDATSLRLLLCLTLLSKREQNSRYGGFGFWFTQCVQWSVRSRESVLVRSLMPPVRLHYRVIQVSITRYNQVFWETEARVEVVGGAGEDPFVVCIQFYMCRSGALLGICSLLSDNVRRVHLRSVCVSYFLKRFPRTST